MSIASRIKGENFPLDFRPSAFIRPLRSNTKINDNITVTSNYDAVPILRLTTMASFAFFFNVTNYIDHLLRNDVSYTAFARLLLIIPIKPDMYTKMGIAILIHSACQENVYI